LFKEQLGYDYYGNWEERDKNSNIEESYLGGFYQTRLFSYGVWQSYL
jgi:type I restriction enzyme R subunit